MLFRSLLEIVNNRRDDPAFKLMLGRLYNSGINRCVLSETFQYDIKTIRSWGKALLRGDPKEIIRILEGRAAGRKRTAAVENFARLRWPYLVAEGSYGAVGRLLHEIETVLEVKISRSGFKDLIRAIKDGTVVAPESSLLADDEDVAPLAESTEAAPVASESAPLPGADLAPLDESLEAVTVVRESSPLVGEDSAVPVADPAPEIRESSAKCFSGSTEELASNIIENKGFPSATTPPPARNTSHPSPFFPRDPAPALYWCDHVGVLIFATALASISKVSGTAQSILAQWMAALWLGAQNIEQTKYLNWEDLQLVLGQVVCYPTAQRDRLKDLAADTGLIDKLWRLNLANLGPDIGTDFYFDPHVKQYTGMQKILKGWCSKIRFADKVVNSDFIHTARGEPLYFETTDNFADMRQRFFDVTARARQVFQWPTDRVITYVLDRGIYGEEVFERVISDPSIHIITWQKGFVAETWDPQKVMGKTSITRVRNSSEDLRTYHFEYIDRVWGKNPKLRQIVVQATNATGRTIQVAILTDDLTRPAEEIIKLIFQRWLQENDFKYLDKHFGINQITSYRIIEYDLLRGQVEDREVKSASRKALDLSLKREKEQLKRHLLAEEQALQAHQRRELKRKELEGRLAQPSTTDTVEAKAIKRQMASIKTADTHYETCRVQRRKDIGEVHQRTAGIQVEIDATRTKESRLEAMIQAQMVKFDGQCKRLMDLLKISARNLFYEALAPFKKAYDNYRDDHEHFRQLTQSPGVLEVQAEQIVIHLMPRSNYGGELRKVVNQTLEQLNAKGLEHPCLPGRKLKFRLGQRSEMEVKLNIDA